MAPSGTHNRCRRALWIELTYIFVNDAIVVRVLVTGVTHPVSVCVLLPRVWNKYAVVLQTTQHTAHIFIFPEERSLGRFQMEAVPACRTCLCNGDSGPDNHQYRYPYHTYSHCPPTRRHTDTHTHTTQKESKMKVNVECCSLEILF